MLSLPGFTRLRSARIPLTISLCDTVFVLIATLVLIKFFLAIFKGAAELSRH
jgi:hypothetical protein